MTIITLLLLHIIITLMSVPIIFLNCVTGTTFVQLNYI